MPPRKRWIKLGSWVLAASWLGGWGFEQTLARGPEIEPERSSLAAACEKAFSESAPDLAVNGFAPELEVRSLGGGRFRLVSQALGHQHRVPFSCEVTASHGTLEVARLLSVSW